MQKTYRRILWSGLTVLLCLSAAPLPADGTALSRSRFEEKVEFYKVSYPPFNYQDARTEAEEKFQTLKTGTPVTIFDGTQNVKGTFRGLRDGWILVDGDSVALTHVVAADRYLYSREEAEIARKKYLEEKFHQYSRKRWDDINEYRRSLERTCKIIEDGTPSADETTEAARKEREKKPIPPLGILRSEVHTSVGKLAAGEIVTDLRKNGFDRYAVTTEDGRNVTIEARNLVIVEGVYDIRDSFLVTQMALAMLAHNQLDEAIFFAKVAAASDPQQKRSDAILEAGMAVNNALTAVKQNNIAINLLEQEIIQRTRQIASNQALLHDDFAVKVGTRDRSTELGQQVLVAREKRKVLQNATKEALEELLQESHKLTEQAGADGDFITACILLDWLEHRFVALAAQARVWWEDDEKQKLAAFFEQQRQALAADYARQIADSAGDRWSNYLDRFVARFGDDPVWMEKLDLKPLYPRMLSAARSSLKEALLYSSAIYNEDWQTVAFAGIKMLLLVPHGDAAEACNTRIVEAFQRLDLTRKRLLELFQQKKYQEFIVECRKMPVASAEWQATVKKAELAMRNADESLQHAVAAADARDLELAQTALQHSLTIWPFNPAAERFVAEFKKQHRAILQDAAGVELYRKSGCFREAMEKCDLMYKEYPQYQRYVAQLRTHLHQAIDAATAARTPEP